MTNGATCRKSNPGLRKGNQSFRELEWQISIYNNIHSNVGGKAQRYVTHEDDDGKGKNH